LFKAFAFFSSKIRRQIRAAFKGWRFPDRILVLVAGALLVEGTPGQAASAGHPWRTSPPLRPSLSFRYTQDVQPDDRCAGNFVSAICIAATVIFWL
jgi:hypothetical protein